MKKTSNLILGIIFVLLGLFFLAINFNIIPDLSFLEIFRNLWPIGFIIAGILLIFKQKALSITLFIITIILGLFFFIVPDHPTNYEKTLEINNIKLDEQTTQADYILNFGIGELNIRQTSNDSNLIESALDTYSGTDTTLDYTTSGNKATIELTRDNNKNLNHLYKIINSEDAHLNWDVRINPIINSTLNLNYGASDVNIDLQNLNITYLNIDCGASDTDIKFGNNTLNAEISSGLANFNLDFYEDVGIVVEVQGGLTDVNLKGFQKTGNKYFSPNHSQANENIKIKIESGLTSVTGGIIND